MHHLSTPSSAFLKGAKALLLAGLGLFLGTQAARADSVYYYSLNTSAFSGQAGYLAFDLIDGDSVNNNLVTVSALTTDGTLADPSTVTLADTSFFNEELRAITFGSFLKFKLELTENFAAPGAFDRFSFFLLDENTFYPLALTSDPSGADSHFGIDIDGNAGGSPGVYEGRLSVPDSGNVFALLLGCMGLMGFARKFTARRSAA